MFSPVGLLRDVSCPFEVESKCGRPHCILGHGLSSLRPPSPVSPSAYDISNQPNVEEYDPAANYDMGFARQTAVSAAPQPLPPRRDKNNNSDTCIDRKSFSKAQAKNKLDVTSPSVSAKYSGNKSLTSLSKKQVEQTLPADVRSDSNLFSACQIIENVDIMPMKISPINDNASESSPANANSSKETRKKIDTIDLTEEEEPPSKKFSNGSTTSFVEAARARLKRNLLSPSETIEARIRQNESKKFTPQSQSFKPQPSADGGRVAHVPKPINLASIKGRPRIPMEYNAKVSSSVRQNFLDKIVNELLKSANRENEWCFNEAIRLEKDGYGRSSTEKVYRQVMANVMLKVRKEYGSNTTSPGKKVATVSHSAMLNRPGIESVGVGLSSSAQSGKNHLEKSQLYRLFAKYIMKEDQLKENGYPVFINSEKGNNTIFIKPPDTRVTQQQSSLTAARIALGERECIRCRKLFMLDPETGQFVSKEECQYHSGRVQKRRTHARNIEQLYSCCGTPTNSMGCQIGSSHVHDYNKLHDLKGYINTKDDNRNPGIFAIDCEMVYTLKGMELARVTVIDHNLREVFDALVRPETEILDYNTTFSGLKACDFVSVTDKLGDIQKKLCKFLNSKSILVGHSLESDLVALKLVHTNIVDTAIVFPHNQGPPFKRALRTLVSEYLRKAIQQEISGHDSSEDAAAAMELMLYKVKQDNQHSNFTATAVSDRSSLHRKNSNF